MSRLALAWIVGTVANGATFVMLIPQIVRLIRTGHTSGVSPAWAITGTVINIGWLTYVIAEGVWLAVPAVIVAIVSFSLTLYLLCRNPVDVRFGVALSLAITAICVAVQITAGWLALGTALALAHGVQFAPSVVAAWRSHTPSGVSPLTWALAGFEGFLWAIYGGLVADVPITLFGLTEVATAGAVLVRLWITRDRIKTVLKTTP